MLLAKLTSRWSHAPGERQPGVPVGDGRSALPDQSSHRLKVGCPGQAGLATPPQHRGRHRRAFERRLGGASDARRLAACCLPRARPIDGDALVRAWSRRDRSLTVTWRPGVACRAARSVGALSVFGAATASVPSVRDRRIRAPVARRDGVRVRDSATPGTAPRGRWPSSICLRVQGRSNPASRRLKNRRSAELARGNDPSAASSWSAGGPRRELGAIFGPTLWERRGGRPPRSTCPRVA
jgi:hypothetical protein